MIYSLYGTIRSISLSGTIAIAFLVIDKPLMQDCGKYRIGKFYIYNKANKQRINIEIVSKTIEVYTKEIQKASSVISKKPF